MAKWRFTRPGTWDYPLLGIWMVIPDDVIELDYAPDAWWESADPGTPVTKVVSVTPSPYHEPADGDILTWDADANRLVTEAPSAVAGIAIAPHDSNAGAHSALLSAHNADDAAHPPLTANLDYHKSDGTAHPEILAAHLAATDPHGDRAAASAAFVAKGSLVYNVRDYGAVGDGVADDTAAIQGAMNALSPNGGTVFFPPGNYKTTTALTPATNVRLKGVNGRRGSASNSPSRLTNTSSHVFTQGAGVLYGFGLEDLGVVATAGDIWHEFNNVVNVFVLSCQLSVGEGYSAIQCSTGTNVTEVDVADTWFFHSNSATVPTIYLKSSNNGVNCNRFRRLRFTYSGDYSIHIESTSGGGYCSDNIIEDVNFEVCNGGLVRLLSCFNTVLDRAILFDPTTTTKDGIYIGKSASGLNSYYTRIKNCGRRGGVLGSGLVDVRCGTSAARYTVVDMSDNITLSGFTVDAGGNSGFAVTNTNGCKVQNPPMNAGVFANTVGCTVGGVMASTASVSCAANGGILSGFYVPQAVSVAKLFWYCATSSGNYDVALLAEDGTVLWSKGSTAAPASGTQQLETVSPVVVLLPGTLYYFMLAADNTTLAAKGSATFSEMLSTVSGKYMNRLATGCFPITSPVTIGAVTAKSVVAAFRSV